MYVEFASLIFTAIPETQILKGFFIDLHGCINIKNHLMQTLFFVQFIGPRDAGMSSILVGTMAIWVVGFSSGVYKIGKIFA